MTKFPFFLEGSEILDIKSIPLNTIRPLIKGKTNYFYIIPEFLSTFPGKLGYYLINWNDSEILFPFIIQKVNKFFKISKIICPTIPIVIKGNSQLSEIYDLIFNLEKHLSKEFRPKIISFYKLPSPDPFNIPGFFSKKWQISPTFSLYLNLNNSLQKIFNELDKRTKYTLRKFTNSSNDELISGEWIKKIPNRIKISTDHKDLPYFYTNWNMIKRKMIREGIKPSEFLEKKLLDKNFSMFSNSDFIKLFLIFDETHDIAASAIVFTIKGVLKNSISYYSAGASSLRGRKLGLPTILQWFIISWLKKNNFDYYDLGGISLSPHHGPSLFKKGFGGRLTRGWILSKQSLFYRCINQIKNFIQTKKAQLSRIFNLN